MPTCEPGVAARRQMPEWRLGDIKVGTITCKRRHNRHLALQSDAVCQAASRVWLQEARRIGKILGVSRTLAGLGASRAWLQTRVTPTCKPCVAAVDLCRKRVAWLCRTRSGAMQREQERAGRRALQFGQTSHRYEGFHVLEGSFSDKVVQVES